MGQGLQAVAGLGFGGQLVLVQVVNIQFGFVQGVNLLEEWTLGFGSQFGFGQGMKRDSVYESHLGMNFVLRKQLGAMLQLRVGQEVQLVWKVVGNEAPEQTYGAVQRWALGVKCAFVERREQQQKQGQELGFEPEQEQRSRKRLGWVMGLQHEWVQAEELSFVYELRMTESSGLGQRTALELKVAFEFEGSES